MSNTAICGLTQAPIQDGVYGEERNPQTKDLIKVVYPEGIASAVFNAASLCKRSRDQYSFPLGEARFGTSARSMHCISRAAGAHPNCDFSQPRMFDIVTTIIVDTSQDLKTVVARSFAGSNMVLNAQQTDQYGRTSAVFVDKDTGIEYYVMVTDTRAKQAMQQSVSRLWDISDPRFTDPEIQIKYNGVDPAQWPNGIPYQGVVPTAQTIQDTAELHARVIVALANELQIDTSNDSFVWDQDRVSKPPWVKHELGTALETLTIEELNKAILDLIFDIQNGIYSSDLLTPTGLNPRAKKFLTEIEAQFIDIEHTRLLNPKQKALLCVGLMLKALDQGTYAQDQRKFYAKSDPSIGQVTWRRYGDTGRDRCEFIRQQHRKFTYRLDLNEVANYTLLHTTDHYIHSDLTYYERYQIRNLKMAQDQWAPTDPTNLKLADLVILNRILLIELVPPRNLGQLRQTREMIISGRKPHPEPEYIPERMQRLLDNANNLFIDTLRAQGRVDYTKENLREVLNLWVDFDNIHPFEEGNGRTGTLFFRHMCKKVFGSDFEIDFPRNETRELINCLGLALDAHHPDITALLEYVYARSKLS